MRAKSPISQTLARMARAAGEPASRARRAVAIHPSQDERPPQFDTEDDLERQRTMADLADLTWLLYAIQATAESPVPQGERLEKFIRGYTLPGAAPPGDPAPFSQRQIDNLLMKAKACVEQFAVNYQPIEIPMQGQRRINWLPAKTTWLAPDQPPKGRLVEATIIANLSAAFLMRLGDLLARYGSLIHPCAEPSCQRLFVKIKRQEYCGKRCSQQVRNAKLRNAPDWQQRQHDYYLEQKRRKAENEVGERRAVSK